MDKKIKILHLEDSLNDAELIHSFIESSSIAHDYYLAENEKDYLTFLESEKIDIILSDFHLPDYDGNEAMKVAQEKYPDIPFIFVSGTMGEDAAIYSVLNGAKDYVLKDNLKRLAPAIKRAMKELDLESMRKQADEALIVSEISYRRLFEAAKDGILILDAETGMIKDVNPFLIQLLGYSKEQFINKAIWEIGFFKDIVANKEKFFELQQNEFVRYEDLPLKTSNGQKINVEFVSNVYLVNNHKVIQCNIRDITRRKKAENALLANNSRLDLAMQVANMAWWEVDVITGIVTFGKRKAEMLGYPPEQFKNYKDFMAIVHPDDVGKTMSAMHDLINGLFDKYEAEYRVLTKSGEYKWFYDIGSVIKKDSKGKPLIVTGLVIDVSQRKHNEEALLASKEYLDKIINTVASPIFVKDTEHKMCLVNDAYCSLVNQRTEDCIGNTGFEHFPKEQVDVFIARDLEVFNTGKESVSEELFTDGWGKVRTIITKKTLYTDNTGNKYLVGVINDITNRKLDELKIIKAMENALESDRLKTAFLSNVSHEIRTPMNAIIGYLDVLTGEEIPGYPKDEIVRIIKSSSSQLLKLINDIIDFSRIEAGAATPKMQSAELSKIITTVYNMFKIPAHKKMLDFQMQISQPCKNIKIITDEPKLRQVLINLVSNAIKFTETGSVQFGCSYNNGKENELLFYVKDTGIGIDEEEHNFVFERFSQSSSIEIAKYGGTGLGLSISKAFVELLGGRIWVESVPGIGSSFNFTLPVGDVKGLNLAAKNADEGRKHLNWKGKTILIAEDNNLNFQLFASILQITGVRILRATNGQDAINKLKEHPEIVLILMDIRMPVMNGLEATRQIRLFDKTIPIIAQTAYAEVEDREKALKAGCNDYQVKPISKELLFESIESFIK